MHRRSTFKRLLAVALPLWREMLVALLFGVLTVGSSIALMGTSSWLIARAALRPSLDKLSVAIVGVRTFGISRAVFRYVERMTSHDVTFKLLARWRVWFYAAAEKLAPAHLNTYKNADLFTRVINDIESLENFYVRVLAPPMIAVLVGIGMVICVWLLAPILSLVLIIVYAVVGLGLPYLSWRTNRQSGQQFSRYRSQLNTVLLDGIQGLSDGFVYGRTDTAHAEIKRLSRSIQAGQRRLARTEAFVEASHVGVIGVSTALLLAVAIPRIEPLYLAPLTLAVTASFEAFLPLALATAYLSQTLAAGERLLDIIDTEPSIQESNIPVPIAGEIHIKIHNLSFRYDRDQAWALRDICLDLPTGKKLAIVGASGAGKSTLVNLLLRFWEVDRGTILLNERPMQEYDTMVVREMIGVMTQQTYIFNTTIYENIKLAKRGVCNEDIYHAARLAQLDTFIESLPQAYQTQVGELGQQLSGGERQRIALARVFLKDSRVLLFDEAFSHLDAIIEQALWQTLWQNWQDKSVLLITHRLIGLEQMDEIVVLENGSIVERGDHDTLIAQQGLYAQMWLRQFPELG